MNKEEEKARLAKIVFEGAPDWCTHAAMDKVGYNQWYWYRLYHVACWFNIKPDVTYSIDEPIKIATCRNQPETTLDWRDTLLKRSDYE